MALKDLLNLSNNNKKIGLSEERVRAIIPAARQYIAFWREYPDMFIDFLQTGGDETRKKEINFYFYIIDVFRIMSRCQFNLQIPSILLKNHTAL